MGDDQGQREATADKDEAIREEIRAMLRAPGAETGAPRRGPVDVKPHDLAALRLISGCG